MNCYTPAPREEPFLPIFKSTAQDYISESLGLTPKETKKTECSNYIIITTSICDFLLNTRHSAEGLNSFTYSSQP